MLIHNPVIAERREFKGALRRLPKLRAGESLYVTAPDQSAPVDAEEALTDETPTKSGRKAKRTNNPHGDE